MSPQIGERFFGPPCSGRKFPSVPKREVGQEPELAALMAPSDGAIDAIGGRSAVRSGRARMRPSS